MYRNYYPYNRMNTNDRSALLPFLAGVLVTTPFIYFAKNDNRPNQYAPPYNPYPVQPYPYGYMVPPYYPIIR